MSNAVLDLASKCFLLVCQKTLEYVHWLKSRMWHDNEANPQGPLFYHEKGQNEGPDRYTEMKVTWTAKLVLNYRAVREMQSAVDLHADKQENLPLTFGCVEQGRRRFMLDILDRPDHGYQRKRRWKTKVTTIRASGGRMNCDRNIQLCW